MLHQNCVCFLYKQNTLHRSLKCQRLYEKRAGFITVLQHALRMVPVEYLKQTMNTLSWKPQKPALILGLSQSLLSSRGTLSWAPGEGRVSVKCHPSDTFQLLWMIRHFSSLQPFFRVSKATKAMSSASQPFCDSQKRKTFTLPSCHLNAD